MLQRIQTIFLILGIVANGFLLYFDLYSVNAMNENGEVIEKATLNIEKLQYETTLEDHMAYSKPMYWLMGAVALVSLVAFASIFLFNNRRLQMIIVRLSMLLEAGLVVLFFLFTDRAKEVINNPIYQMQYEVGIFLPIAGVVMFFLANVFIMRDEKLVRSSERLR